jgi:tetratricopeptide (TPR) repeat protein
MAFEMLAGVPPFRGATTQALLAAHMTQAPPSLGSLRQAVPPGLDTIVRRCLEKRPADRLQTAADLIQELEKLTSSQSSVQGLAPNVAPQPPALRVALFFGAASVAILGLVWVLVQWLGLPDWVIQTAIALLVVGLPIIMVTSQREQRRAEGRVATPAGIQRLFTWRRSIQGGMLAFATLGLATTAFMTSRALGVGPGATLMSAGILNNRDRLLIADFQNRTTDSTLGLTITQLVRIDLAQSPSLSVMEPSQVAEVLGRMERDRSASVTPEIAREVAAREGIKAYLVGDLVPAGGGFVIVARLLSTSTGDALVSLRQTVASPEDLMEGVDKVSAKLREMIGESLRSVRADPPLEQVTTSSLSALRLYVEALKVHDKEGPDRGLTLLDRAIAEDSTFAMAWRRYAAWATNPGTNPTMRARGDSAAEKAFQLRSRLPQRERLNVEAMYHMVVTGDYERAATAYTSVLENYPNDATALNNLGVVADRLGRASEALDIYQRAMRAGSVPALTYSNAIFTAGNLARLDVADSVIVVFRRNVPESTHLLESAISLANYRQDFASVDSIAHIMLRGSGSDQLLGYIYLSMTAELSGRMTEAAQHMRNALREEQERGQISAAEAAMVAQVHDVRLAAEYSDNPGLLLKRLRPLLEQNRAFTATRPPLASRFELFVPLFAQLGDAETASHLFAEFADRMTRSQFPAVGARIRTSVIDAAVTSAAGKPDEALAKIRDGCSLAPGFGALCERMAFIEVAQAHDRAGRVDSAIAAYQRFVELRGARVLNPPRAFDPATPKLAPAWRRLGELYESKGDRRSALDAYERFLGYWREADPELQPIVSQVRQRADRLRRAIG